MTNELLMINDNFEENLSPTDANCVPRTSVIHHPTSQLLFPHAFQLYQQSRPSRRCSVNAVLLWVTTSQSKLRLFWEFMEQGLFRAWAYSPFLLFWKFVKFPSFITFIHLSLENLATEQDFTGSLFKKVINSFLHLSQNKNLS